MFTTGKEATQTSDLRLSKQERNHWDQAYSTIEGRIQSHFYNNKATNRVQRSTLGLVIRAEEQWVTPRYIPIIGKQQSPDFEAVLGRGLSQHFTTWFRDRKGKEWTFHIALRYRADRRVNEALHRLYPPRGYNVDIAVTRIGLSGRAIPFRGVHTRIGALTVVQRQVLPLLTPKSRVEVIS